jgi:hypothetical protein
MSHVNASRMRTWAYARGRARVYAPAWVGFPCRRWRFGVTKVTPRHGVFRGARRELGRQGQWGDEPEPRFAGRRVGIGVVEIR